MRHIHVSVVAFLLLALDYLTLAALAIADLVSNGKVHVAFAVSCPLATIGLIALVVLVATRFRG